MSEVVVRSARVDELPAVMAFWQGAAENGHRPADTLDAVVALHRRDPEALLLAIDTGDGGTGNADSDRAGEGGGAGDGERDEAGGRAGEGGRNGERGTGGGGEIVGTIIAGWDGWRCHLYRLAVAPDRRRAGIGRALIAAAEGRLRALGGTRADAMVLDDNGGAHAAWAAVGYERQGEWSRWIKPL